MPKVTEAHLEARRQQILDAAWACFARKGYHQTTMQDICEESDLSPGAIYRYFASKEAIRTAVYDRHRDWARDLLETARSQAGGPLDTLEVLGQTMWLSFFNDPTFETMARVEIENWPEVLRDKDLLDDRRKEMAFWRTLVTQLLSEAKERGQLKPEVDPEALAVLFICAHEGLRHYRLVDPDSFQPERVYGVLLALLSEGALTEADNAGTVPPTETRAPHRHRRKGAADARVRD